MKIKTALNNATKKLAGEAVETPDLDVRILLCHVLKKPQEFLVAHDDYELHEQEKKFFDELIQRRAEREPVAQILEAKEFYGYEFYVSKDVLVPRPETELIIDAVKDLYATDKPIRILELGVGSGCILLTLLKEFPKAKGVGIDISNLALANAKKNAYNLGIKNVKFVHSDWCEKLGNGSFDLIISNPPYIPKSNLADLERELLFEPLRALDGGDDGLDCYRRIAAEIEKIEFKNAIFEIGINQHDAVKAIFESHGLNHVKTINDYRNIERTIIFRKENE